jgi:DNA-binding NarL/FixJ family response regulator
MENKTPEYRILIADDHQILIDGIHSMLLKEKQFKIVKEAADGQEALDLIQQQPQAYDLLISDISMPLLSGIELCRVVKRDYPQIKVLMLSMYNNSTHIHDAIEAEADGYLLKSTGKKEFVLALKKIMNNGSYYSESLLPMLAQMKRKEEAKAKLVESLTPRELEILKLITMDFTSEEIAEKLFISKKTVDNHRQHILNKIGSKSTVGLVRFAIENGL